MPTLRRVNCNCLWGFYDFLFVNIDLAHCLHQKSSHICGRWISMNYFNVLTIIAQDKYFIFLEMNNLYSFGKFWAKEDEVRGTSKKTRLFCFLNVLVKPIHPPETNFKQIEFSVVFQWASKKTERPIGETLVFASQMR